MNKTGRAELIADLRLNHEYCPKEVILKAADMLEADAQELTRLRDLARDAANAATQLQKQVLLLRAQRIAVTPEMVSAYLKANDAYWKRTDEMPPVNPSRWRQGTPSEATYESLCAALAPIPQMEAQQVPAPAWKAERIDDYEIRVTSPEGESWRLRSADRNDSFNNFIWRWAESMVNKGD